jgi:hypothetical protein
LIPRSEDLQILLGLTDICILVPFVARAKQQDDSMTESREVDAISWTIVDPHFEQTISKRFTVAKISTSMRAIRMFTFAFALGSFRSANHLPTTSVPESMAKRRTSIIAGL